MNQHFGVNKTKDPECWDPPFEDATDVILKNLFRPGVFEPMDGIPDWKAVSKTKKWPFDPKE